MKFSAPGFGFFMIVVHLLILTECFFNFVLKISKILVIVFKLRCLILKLTYGVKVWKKCFSEKKYTNSLNI